MTGRLYTDISIIQSLPPSNVNRDDSGSPKHAEFGGVKRARMSSQSQKRHARMHFASHLPEQDRATRTSRLQQLLAERLTESNGDAALATRLAAAAIDGSLKIKRSNKNAELLSYLLFCGYNQIDAMAERITERLDSLAELEGPKLTEAMKKLKLIECLGHGNPAEVALFGRMVADATAVNVDAAVQVAHAISTHRVHNKFDYYTVVDDENQESAGAGKIGNVEFNSATYYRYATLGVHQLLANLGDQKLTAQTATGFVRSFALTLPAGHQNSFAHHARPHAVVIALREDQPVNLVNAFEDPIKASVSDGFAARSVKRLAEEMSTTTEIWGEAPGKVLATYTVPVDDELRQQFGAPLSFPELSADFEATVATWLETGRLQ